MRRLRQHPLSPAILLAAVVVVATSVLLAGCGGGGTRVLSQEEWVERSNEMCKQQREQWEQWQQELDAAGSPQAAAQIFERILPEIRAMAEEAVEMGPPEGNEERYRESLAYDARIVELYEELPAALREQDQARLQSMDEQFADLVEKNSELVRELGADECLASSTD